MAALRQEERREYIFTHVRYGDEPEAAGEREQAAQAWTRLEQALNDGRKGIE